MLDRDAKCPRCGSTLPVVIVEKPILQRHPTHEMDLPMMEITGHEEVEEHGDCIRCHGAS